MCGIVGYIGPREACPILLKGLHRLEYRGYDSAGVALINNNGNLSVYKSKGKVADLENHINDKDISGTIGVAHTRWATHGEPNTTNAHPHYSQSGDLALIHNGIIENYKPLKQEMMNQGRTFQSETDTEVLIQFIEYIKEEQGCDLFTAVQLALKNVIGAYAIVVIDKSNPDRLIAARKGSPLVIGIGENEFYIGSDATPLIEYTNKVIYLGEEEIAMMTRKGDLQVVNLENVAQTPLVKTLEMNLSDIEKGGFPHYMLKEIFEQPDALLNSMKGRLNTEEKDVLLSAIINHRDRIMKAERVIICACGTSWHAGLIGKYIIEELTRIPVEVEYSSEFRYRNPVITDKDLVIAISQSGETADTLAAIQLAKDKGAFLYGICNVVGSSIPRATDTGSYLHIGPEIGVASTKAFTAQVTTLMLIAMAIAKEKQTISKEYFHQLVDELQSIPEKIRRILELNDKVAKYSKIFTYARNFIYLGRGYNYPIALEGALKLKEISYIHAEGYPSAEMKHGPIALIDEEMPVVVIAPAHSKYEKILSNVQEIKARKGKIISIITEGDTAIKELSDIYFEIPSTIDCFTPLLTIVPLQLISYYIAIAKGRDVDQPRNLAKSVTVE
ncbi:MAG: glutamine--fructose-6-phosphate transaminase (isomerizing) [Bacteroidales bacterium]|nr:glutamine--fructose-6-phosphate transaminase (isomerizing) [Bacteroidales bacterium]